MASEPLQLNKAIVDAKLLLAYAAQTGLPQEATIVQAIVEAERAKDATSGVDAALEVRFWQTFTQLALGVAPVTIESLVATEGALTSDPNANGWKRFLQGLIGRSRAGRAVRVFFFWTLFFLLLLLAIQLYWFLGSKVLTEHNTNKAVLERTMVELQSVQARRPKPGDSADDNPQVLIAKITSLQTQIRANVDFGVSLLPRGLRPAELKEEAPTPDLQAARLAKIEDQYEKTWSFVLLGLQSYILPLLYGALGACVFVLRSLIRDIHLRTYKSNTSTLYWLRVILGSVAGLAIGWFLGSALVGADAHTQLAALSPLALAFMAGYGVELLFSLMDNLVSAFSSTRASDSAAIPGATVAH